MPKKPSDSSSPAPSPKPKPKQVIEPPTGDVMQPEDKAAEASEQKRFCAYCGKPAVPGAKFCAHCGKSTETPQAEPDKKEAKLKTKQKRSPARAAADDMAARLRPRKDKTRAAPLPPAGLLYRSIAACVDMALLVFVFFVTASIAGHLLDAPAGDASPWVLAAIVTGMVLAANDLVLVILMQQSFGKILVGISVNDGTGEALSVGSIVLRFFVKYFPILFFGWVFAAFRPDRRALHDLWSSSQVTQDSLTTNA